MPRKRVKKVNAPFSDELAQVIEELNRANAHFPPFNSAHGGFAVLLEEVDELWDIVRLKQTSPGRDARMRAEAIQVMAMAWRFLVDCCGGKK